MTTAASVTVARMVEALPPPLQERVVEHLREYVDDLRDDARWNDSFARTKGKLAAAAREARQQIADGKATPLDVTKL
jgi:hypothetical protein